jgi:DNA-binding CsgD family transcriptional regulator
MLDEKRSGGLLNQNPDMPGNRGNAADPCPLRLRNYDYHLGGFRAFPEGDMWLITTSFVSSNLPFELKPAAYIVGRSRSAPIRIKDRTVSKEHALLICQGKIVLVKDLGSLNHTFINDREVKSGEVEVGDEVQFGAVRCRLSSSPILADEAQSEGSMSTLQVLPANLPTLDISGLTPAQQEVLGLVLQGLDDRVIARQTGRSPATVHTHLREIFRFFKVHSRAELIVTATRHRLP